MTTGPALPFGALLRRHRLALDLTQEELAERAGLSPRVISEIERGGPHLPRKDTVALLANALALAEQERATFVTLARARALPASPDLLLPTGGHGAGRHAPAPPAPLTPLIGREQEIAALRRLLLESPARLVTLTGPGGIGKTRLAVAVATVLMEEFADGACVVQLAPLRDDLLVLPTIAQALGVVETGERSLHEIIVGFLRDKTMLLLLDNFEHVIDAAPVVPVLLAACTKLKVLVTSRIVLRLTGEHVVAVRPLPLPEPQALPPVDQLLHYAAVRLFVQRAQAARADFTLTPENAPVVAEICVRLDGLPLALELAAARLRLLRPHDLLTRLGHRLQLLTGGPRDLPAHQQTLRTTIAWSYDLLEAHEQMLLRHLSVFVQGWTLEAAERVCGAWMAAGMEVLDGLSSLVDKSLVYGETAPEAARFRLLETIREYAAEQLAAAPEAEQVTLRQAHAAYYLSMAEEVAGAGGYPSQWGWLTSTPAGQGCQEKLAVEQDNLRAALQWAHESANLDLGARLAGALGWFWFVEGQWTEGRTWLETFHALEQARMRAGLSVARDAPVTRYLDAAGLARLQGDAPRGIVLLTESLALLRRQDDRRGVAILLACLGVLAGTRQDPERYEESLALCRDLGDTEGIAFALTRLAHIAFLRGETARGKALQDEARAVVHARDDRRLIVTVLGVQGTMLARYGDLPVARALLDEYVLLARVLRDRGHLVGALVGCAAVARVQGDYGHARSLLEEGLSLLQGGRIVQQYVAAIHLHLGQTAREEGDLTAATAHTDESLGLSRFLDDRQCQAEALETQALIAWEQGDLPRAAALGAAALDLCQTVRTEDDDPVAQVLASLGLIARSQGNLKQAQVWLVTGLQRAAAARIQRHTLACLDGLAGLATERGDHAPAVTVFAATAGLRATVGAILPPVLRTLYAGDIERARVALGGGFARAWQAGQTLTLEQVVASALAEFTNIINDTRVNHTRPTKA